MTVQEFAAAHADTVVTQGRYTMLPDAARDQEDTFLLMKELHPDVRLAHHTWVPCSGTHEIELRSTAPGAARDGHVVICARIPAALGAMDAATHITTASTAGGDTPAIRGRLPPVRHATPYEPDRTDAEAAEPPYTPALVTDTAALAYTDDGLWFTRLPAPVARVPLGHNLAAHLAGAFPTTGGATLCDDIPVPALSFYWDALRHTLARRIPPAGCPCGRVLDAHRPPVARVLRLTSSGAQR